MLKIWGRVNSINVQKVMWAVAELKIPHERVDAGMAFGVVNTPEYRTMNPNGRVPTIDYDGFVLWESNTIVRYLYAKHGPSRTFEQGYAAEKWMDWTTSHRRRADHDDLLAAHPHADREARHARRRGRDQAGHRHLQDRRRRARGRSRTCPAASSRWATSRSAAS